MQFFILMVDYGRGPQRPMGLEATVQPELTRRAIVEMDRDILAEGRNTIAFVKFVDGNSCIDLTEEICAEASALVADDEADLNCLIHNRIMTERDRARDHRKNWAAI